MSLLGVIGILLICAGCDSIPFDPNASTCALPSAVQNQYELVLKVPIDTLRLSLDADLFALDGSGPIDYSVRVTDRDPTSDDVVKVQRADPDLLLFSSQAGQATVTVNASDRCDNHATVTLAVEASSDWCTSTDAATYFPISIGRRWRYSYWNQTRRPDGLHSISTRTTSGTLEWTQVDQSCEHRLDRR